MKLERKDYYKIKHFHQILQGGKDKQSGEVDLYDHVNVVLGKHLAHVGQHYEDDGGDEDSEYVPKEGAAKDENYNHSRLVFASQ